MKLTRVAFVICVVSASALPSEDPPNGHLGRKLKQETNTTHYEYEDLEEVQVCRELENDDGSVRRVCSTVARRVPFRCSVERKRSALGPSGLLGGAINTNGLRSCCEMCRAAPSSGCRSWWRERGFNLPCYINSNS